MQRQHNVRRYDYCIDALVGVRAVARNAVYVYNKLRGGCIHAAFCKVYAARGHGRVNVHAHYAGYLGAVQPVVRNHALRPAYGFLRRLEEKLHRALELALHGLEYLCRAEQNGCVYIMPAGVHNALVHRCIGQPRAFGYGQRVNIRAYGYAVFCVLGANGCNYAVPGNVGLVWYAKLIKLSAYRLFGALLMLGKLRMHMQVAPDFHQFFKLVLYHCLDLCAVHMV